MSNKHTNFIEIICKVADKKGHSFVEITDSDFVNLYMILNQKNNDYLIALDTPAVINNAALALQLNREHKHLLNLICGLQKQFTDNYLDNLFIAQTEATA